LVVYPNPAEASCTIQWSIPEKAAILELMDVLGRTVRLYQVRGTTVQLELDDVPPGTYYLHLRDAKRWLAGGKVVVQ